MSEQSWRDVVEELDDLEEKPVVYEFSKGQSFTENEDRGAYNE
jgi:hypothetical protein